ncbi:hypothetical protein N7474_001109 [Penicillium riverlandense]|uniref:uncharacterized protein n=1 Tax=Penicillium riverlandense TaxID=1903569 RepID=UPI0025478C52|nr:uncharacterized protein N7474_001109 [Penicillium riverlandense]KAJ5832798.1 hypothetical protein N7474_001109 [Penicillium riverlandense]
MYSAVIRRTIKPSGLHITKLARASYADKIPHTPSSGGSEDFVHASFPDDFESSPLRPDLQGPKTNVKGSKEAALHEASTQAKQGQAQSPAAQRAKNEKDPTLNEKEPELDEIDYSSSDPLDPALQLAVKTKSFLGHHTDDEPHRRSNPRRLGAEFDRYADHGGQGVLKYLICQLSMSEGSQPSVLGLCESRRAQRGISILETP